MFSQIMLARASLRLNMETHPVSGVQPGYGPEPGLSRCCFSISADAAMIKIMKNSNTLLVIISSNRDCQL
jgi:hypothetical protein